YEQWTGVVRFALDPNAAANQQIVDLKLAPRNAEGKVEFRADFRMLVPADLSKANGAVFYEVNNRGGATAPRLIEASADDFLCRQGFVVLWSGWIAQVQPGDGRLRLQAPIATEAGMPIRGIVREEVIVDRPQPKAAISHRGNQGSYLPTERGFASAKVTRREREADPRQEVPRDEWKLVSSMVGTPQESGQLPLIELEIAGGLKPGWIYEVVYEAEGPIVQGVGLAGIRDILSALKFGNVDQNPLRTADGKPVVSRALGFGTSQSGRLLRHFLWDGFNADEQGRKAFDGVISHVAGGGLGYFNHRFASPTRTNGQHDEHLFPADYFPFTYGDMSDPLSGKTDGILAKSRRTNTTPKVFHTQSSSEYWHRSGSLVHTDPLAKTDAEIPPDVRIYTFGGTQHGSGSGFPGPRGNGQLPASPADYSPLMRALVVALDAWVKDGAEPPPSAYPRIADGTLADWQRDKARWPAIDGVNYPAVIQQPHFLDRGPKWDSQRISAIEPPAVKGNYVVKVPAYDADGNEKGTLNLPAITVPVATYTSWNLRHESIGAAGELLSLQGGYIPFAKDPASRAAAKDPRPSIAERYKSYGDYEQRYMEAAEKLLAQRYLLAEDLPRLKALCERFKPVFE
ncbi:MAG TPA: alpha/beta hydrolase domain-containing protein, partial [Pirellulaceae bacterium]|nr:alpha/beta hydrolase domain-containing protein [Pirellulaceae bacterium]